MSRENVEVVASVYEAWARRDGTSAFDLYDADIEWDMSRVALVDFVSGNYRGHVYWARTNLRRLRSIPERLSQPCPLLLGSLPG